MLKLLFIVTATLTAAMIADVYLESCALDPSRHPAFPSLTIKWNWEWAVEALTAARRCETVILNTDIAWRS